MSVYELNAWVRPDGEYRLAFNPKDRELSNRIPDPKRLARADEKRERRRLRNLANQ